MNEAQRAWQLWHQLQNFCDALWTQYERAFLDFCIEEGEDDAVRPISTDSDLPF